MEQAPQSRNSMSGLHPGATYGTEAAEAATVNAEVNKLDALIKQFNQKEQEMLKTGGQHISQISWQTQRLGAQIAKARGGGDIQSQLIGAAVGAVVGAGLTIYNNHKAKRLAEERKQFAVENVGALAGLGRQLRQAGSDSVGLFGALDKKELVLLDGHSLPNYRLVLKSLVDYQRSILHLAERYEVFRTYYVAVSEWAEQEVEPALVEPFLDRERWIDERVRSAEAAMKDSSSLLYHFSPQGHLLLFLPGKRSTTLINFEARVLDLFDYYVHPSAGLKITERFDYVTNARELLSGSHLGEHVEKKYRHVRRRHSLYLKRYWIIFGILSVFTLFAVSFISLIALLSDLINSIFS